VSICDVDCREVLHVEDHNSFIKGLSTACLSLYGLGSALRGKKRKTGREKTKIGREKRIKGMEKREKGREEEICHNHVQTQCVFQRSST